MKLPEKNRAEIEKLSADEKELNEQRKQEELAFQKIMSSLQKETKGFQEEKDKLQADQIKLQKTYDEMKSAVKFLCSFETNACSNNVFDHCFLISSVRISEIGTRYLHEHGARGKSQA